MAIQLFVPTFDIEGCLGEIRECLEKGWTGMGFKTLQFEQSWKKYTGLKNAYFLNSATSGLNLTFEILKEEYKWEDGDEILTTPFTFVSSNHAILLSNLKPVFVDVDEYLCLDPRKAELLITEKTKALLFVGLGGSTGRYNEVVALCEKYNLKLILDAAHMSGTRLNGVVPGKEAEVVVYSYQAVKNLPTADSGMVCFAREDLDKKARIISWLGIDKDTYERSTSGGNYKWRYDVEYVGNKLHGNSIMAAIGIVQLRHLDNDNARRREIAQKYRLGFKDSGDKIKIIPTPEGCESAHHLFQIMLEDRDELLTYLNENDIFPGVHYIENTCYRMYSYAHGTCRNAEYASDHILSLPLHLRLQDSDIECIIEKINKYINEGKS